MSSTGSLVNSVMSALGSSSDGIDVTATVSNIIYADEAGMRQLQSQQTTLGNETTAINQLETQASTVSDDLNNLSDIEGPLNAVAATSSNSTALTASAAADASSGSYTVSVQQLATTAEAYSNTVSSSSAALGSGSFDINVGGTTTTISTASDGDTLADLVSSINSQNLGVTASVVNDSSGAILSLVASSSGAAGNFTISNSSGALSFQQPTTGTDAQLTVNGVPITSSSNNVTTAVSGLTLNLQSLVSSSNPVTVSVAPDSSSMVSAIDTFVSDYNTLITNVNSQFGYNTATSSSGPLAGDSVVEGLQSALLSATNYSYTGGAYTSLASLGITTNSDGTLSVDTNTLDAAISNNYSGVVQFFQGTALNGFANDMTNALNTYIDPSQGAFTVELSSINSESTDLADQISSETSYYASLSTTLTTQYNEVDIELQQLPVTLQQTDALLGFNNSNNSNNG